MQRILAQAGMAFKLSTKVTRGEAGKTASR
jgi:hypothetical protein